MTNTVSGTSWDDYRRRVRWFLGVWLGGFVVAVSTAWVLSHTPASAWAPFATGILWLASFATAAIRLQLFRCPQCGHQFFKSSWYYWPFARNCVHCGLPKWHT
jgi:hypothetical protein